MKLWYKRGHLGRLEITTHGQTNANEHRSFFFTEINHRYTFPLNTEGITNRRISLRDFDCSCCQSRTLLRQLTGQIRTAVSHPLIV
jgi:hypothetical protein